MKRDLTYTEKIILDEILESINVITQTVTREESFDCIIEHLKNSI